MEYKITGDERRFYAKRGPKGVNDALFADLKEGKTVAIAANKNFLSARSKITSAARYRGLSVATAQDRDADELVVWLVGEMDRPDSNYLQKALRR
jgi:hypothetical protein